MYVGPAGPVWFVNAPRAPISGEERDATTDEQWQRWLVSLFDHDAGPAAALIHAGRLELSGDSTYDLPHVPVWHRDRLIIIGDAAHAPAPSSGQGASMALEDAVVLAKALRDSDSVEAGFAAYEAARRDRVERIVAQGARSSSTKTPGPIGRFVRDTFLRLAFRYFMTPQSMAWIYDHRIDWRRPFVVADARLTPSRTLG